MAQPVELDALCIGETMVMVTPETSVPLRSATSFVLRAGGAESNVAMFLSALGHRVAWASRLGADALGEVVLDAVRASGVDTSCVEISSREPTGVYFKDPAVEGTRVYYYRSSSAAARMTPGFLDRFSGLRPRVVHVSGITPALSQSCSDLVDEIVISRALGDVRVSFDVNYRSALWSSSAASGMLLRLAQAADIVFVGLDEAAELWGTTNPEEVRREVAAPQWVIVKDGGRKAVEFGPSGTWEVPALAVDPVEPVGAGDAFAAGWLSGWLGDRTAKARLRLGHLMAAVAMSSTSDHAAVPGPEAIRARLELDDEKWVRSASPTSHPQEADANDQA